MVAIGIRSSNTEVYYSVLENSEPEIIRIETCSYIAVPVALEFPEKLNFVRKTLKDIILEFGVTRAGVRISEPTARSVNITRVSIEAVIQELFASSSIEKYLTGQISSISARLGFPRENFKRIISGEMAHEIFPSGKKYNLLEKESILVGLAAIKIR